MYLKEMVLSILSYTAKIFTDYTFYIGGAVLGFVYYLTGLSIGQLQSILLVIFIDIGTRIWAERANKRRILSRRMFAGFAGKFASYMILFTLAQHSFVLKDVFQYAILGGFSLIEFRSVYENLLEAKQRHIKVIGDKVNDEIDKFLNNKTTSNK